MIEPLISVIIPVYNRAETVLESLDSILEQTYKNIEVLIVDDFSNDGTAMLLGNICDERVKLFTLERNYGACYARNYGVDHCIGEYVAFQDSDDTWHPTKLQIQYDYLIANKLDMVFCSMLRTKDNLTQIYPNDMSVKLIGKESYHEIVLGENIASTQTILAYRSVFLKERFDISLGRFQDWDVMIRISKAYNVSFLDKVLVKSSLSVNSISRNNLEGIRSLEKFLVKYYEEYANFPNKRGLIYENIGDLKVLSDIDAAADYYNALKCRFSLKILVKFLVVKCVSSYLLKKLWEN